MKKGISRKQSIKRLLDQLSQLADRRIDPATNEDWLSLDKKYQSAMIYLEKREGPSSTNLFRTRYNWILEKFNRRIQHPHPALRDEGRYYPNRAIRMDQPLRSFR